MVYVVVLRLLADAVIVMLVMQQAGVRCCTCVGTRCQVSTGGCPLSYSLVTCARQ